jgi:carboxypeptidase Taq
MFAPQLKKIVELVREQAERLGYKEHPYDALLDAYEPEVTTADVQEMFDQLRPGLRQVLDAIDTSDAAQRLEPALGKFTTDQQMQLARWVMDLYGFDFKRGRIDISAHPFCTSFSRDDVRITTRIAERDVIEPLAIVMHETGHALYEQGIAPGLMRTGIGGGVSLGIHESITPLGELSWSQSWFLGELFGRHPGYLSAAHIGVA